MYPVYSIRVCHDVQMYSWCKCWKTDYNLYLYLYILYHRYSTHHVCSLKLKENNPNLG